MSRTPSGAFTVRLEPDHYKLLQSMANLQGLPVATLARNLIRKGMKKALNPEEIERALERERAFLLKQAAKMQEEDDR